MSKKRPEVKVKPDPPNDKTKTSTKYNYEVVISGNEVEVVAKTMTESQARCILEHFVKTARLNNIFFSVKRLTPEIEDYYGINFVNTPQQASITQSPTTMPQWTHDSQFGDVRHDNG